MAGVFASDGALLTNEPMADIFAIGGAYLLIGVRRAYLPAMMPATHRACGLRICRTRWLPIPKPQSTQRFGLLSVIHNRVL